MKSKIRLTHIIILFSLLNSIQVQAEKFRSSRNILLMGSSFTICAVGDDSVQCRMAIDSAIADIRSIELMISSWIPDSYTCKINKNAGIAPVKVPYELFHLIKRSKKISTLTSGAFDISVGPLLELWDFKTLKVIPPDSTVLRIHNLVNFNNIILYEPNQSVFLKNQGMKISFGAIGKGYAANHALARMKEFGISGGFVNASGDNLYFGTNENNEIWKTGIADPSRKGSYFGWLQITDIAIVTSGDYEKFAVIDNRRFAHIIDARTGYPANQAHSVTIICPDAEIADALATSVLVLGPVDGLALINKLKNIEAIIVTEDRKIVASNGVDLKTWQINGTTP